MNGLHVLVIRQMCYINIPVNNQLMLGFLTQGLSNQINNATQYNILIIMSHKAALWPPCSDQLICSSVCISPNMFKYLFSPLGPASLTQTSISHRVSLG